MQKGSSAPDKILFHPIALSLVASTWTNGCELRRYFVRCRYVSYSDEFIRPCIERRSHRLEVFGVIVMFSRDRARGMIQDSFDDLVGDTHVAQVGCYRPAKIVRVEILLYTRLA